MTNLSQKVMKMMKMFRDIKRVSVGQASYLWYLD